MSARTYVGIVVMFTPRLRYSPALGNAVHVSLSLVLVCIEELPPLTRIVPSFLIRLFISSRRVRDASEFGGCGVFLNLDFLWFGTVSVD